MSKISFMTPVVTAFNPDGSLDVQGNKNVYEHLIKGGVDGIVVMGSTGEFFSMSMQDKKKLVDVAAETIKGRTRLLIGASCMDWRETVELGNYAIDAGAEAVMIVPPYYFALSDASVMEYYGKVAPAIHGDILLYNFPDRTGYDLKPEIILELARAHKNIVGLKDTVEKMGHTREVIKALRPEFPEFEILSGYDDNLVHNVMSGGNGCIGGLSNLAPEITSAWAKAVREGDLEGMVKGQRTIDQMMDLYAIGTPFIPISKRAMQLRGIEISDTCTVPFLPANAEQEAQIKAFMTRVGLL